MIVHADVRRVAGGLQLVLRPAGWAMRLNYDQAARLISAIRTDTTCALPAGGGRVIIGYLPNHPDPGEASLIRFEGEVDLANATVQVPLARKQWREIATLIDSHMPGRLPPLPGGPDTPWTPDLDR
jgi:YD repeat-containing protein